MTLELGAMRRDDLIRRLSFLDFNFWDAIWRDQFWAKPPETPQGSADIFESLQRLIGDPWGSPEIFIQIRSENCGNISAKFQKLREGVPDHSTSKIMVSTQTPNPVSSPPLSVRVTKHAVASFKGKIFIGFVSACAAGSVVW